MQWPFSQNSSQKFEVGKTVIPPDNIVRYDNAITKHLQPQIIIPSQQLDQIL